MSSSPRLLALLPFLFPLFAQAPTTSAGNVDLPRFPSLSHDGTRIAFSWRGDLWTVAASGGQAMRLTSHPADDGKSAWLADDSGLVFESERQGARNVWLIRRDGTGMRQITTLDTSSLSLSAVANSPHGLAVYFDANLEGDLFRSTRPYYVPLTGGEPVRTHGAFGTDAAPDESGQRVLFERGGSSWSRRHYRGPDQRDVWLFDRQQPAAAAFTRLTEWNGNDGHARFLSGDTFVFLSDREFDTVNLYRQTGNGAAERLTSWQGQDLKDLAVSGNGALAAFTVWDRLYTISLRQKSEPTPIAIIATEDFGDGFEQKAMNSLGNEGVLSPDGKVMAVVAYGDVWIKGIDSKLPARRVTETAAREQDVAFSADGETLFFTSDQSGNESIWQATVTAVRDDVKKSFELATKPAGEAVKPAANQVETQNEKPADKQKDDDEPEDEVGAADTTGSEEQKSASKKVDKKDAKEAPNRWLEAVSFAVTELIGGAENDRQPVPSPDGKHLAFRRGRGDLCLFELATKTARVLRSGWDPSIEYIWSPDATAIAFAQDDINFNKDIWIVPVDGSKPPVNVTRHPDNDTRPRFSHDGKVLAFLSERTNEELDAWYVFLDKSLETLSRFEQEQHWKAASEVAKKRKPLAKRAAPKLDDAPAPPAVMPAWDLADAYLRVRRITSAPGNESNLELLPSGDRILISTNEGLQTVRLDGTETKKIAGTLRVMGLSLSGDHAFGIAAGKAATLALAGGDMKTAELDAVILVDKQQRNSQKFLEAARALGEEFYHPTMKGLDWPALTATYHQLARQARTADEFDYVANRFLGELNASHLGIRTPRGEGGPRLPQGRVGLQAVPIEAGFQVARVIEQMPAMRSKTPLQPGDVITAVDYKPVATNATLESHFTGRSNRETVATVVRTLADGRTVTFDTFVEPVAASAAAEIAYENAWRGMAARVEEWSAGRLGYIHIQGMDQPSLDEFERGLYAATEGKDGLIVDVRNNGGGWTADRLMASLAAPRHAYTVPRGQDPSITTGYPQDRLFIQRCIVATNMLCNEKSFSNAEITAHAFKAVKRGTLVGQQTYGGVISTGGIVLLDGTTCRMPTRGWYTLDGVDMENHGAMPDLLVAQTPQDEAADFDAQLKAAVDDLLQRLPRK